MKKNKKNENQLSLEIPTKEETPAFPNRECLKYVCIYCAIFWPPFWEALGDIYNNSVNHSPHPLSPVGSKNITKFLKKEYFKALFC